MNTLTSSKLISGSQVINQNNTYCVIGQIQSFIKKIITINFENFKKKVNNIKEINLKLIRLK